MPISKNFSDFIRRYKEENHLSIAKLSDELDVTKSATVNYLNGDCNPRADTLDLLAEKCGVSVAEMISPQSPGWERAETLERAARLFSGLPPEQRDRAVSLFLSLVDILSEEDPT